jgi:hypothetical protein
VFAVSNPYVLDLNELVDSGCCALSAEAAFRIRRIVLSGHRIDTVTKRYPAVQLRGKMVCLRPIPLRDDLANPSQQTKRTSFKGLSNPAMDHLVTCRRDFGRDELGPPGAVLFQRVVSAETAGVAAALLTANSCSLMSWVVAH